MPDSGNIRGRTAVVVAAILAAGTAVSCNKDEPVARQVATTASQPAPRPADTNSSIQDLTPITVYKSPTCGCCNAWIEHLEANGFTVQSEDRDDMQVIKDQHGVPRELHSCHTAIVDNYVIEGHVPADDIKRLLAETPDLAGLSAPGMPQKSPGMQPPGLPPSGYDVVAFAADGETSVYMSYE